MISWKSPFLYVTSSLLDSILRKSISWLISVSRYFEFLSAKCNCSTTYGLVLNLSALSTGPTIKVMGVRNSCEILVKKSSRSVVICRILCDIPTSCSFCRVIFSFCVLNNWFRWESSFFWTVNTLFCFSISSVRSTTICSSTFCWCS